MASKQDMESKYEQIQADIINIYKMNLSIVSVIEIMTCNLFCVQLFMTHLTVFYPIFSIFFLHATYGDVFVDPVSFM